MEFVDDTDEWEFNVKFNDITSSSNPDYRPLTEVYVVAPFNNETPFVWLDTYGGKTERQTTYGHIPPDEAEAIGMALILAARVARGEITRKDL